MSEIYLSKEQTDAILKLPEFMKNTTSTEKKIKGYGFDSLVFRYKLAREAEARYKYKEARKNGDLHHEESYYLGQANRDIMRFIQILDDLIGEHD